MKIKSIENPTEIKDLQFFKVLNQDVFLANKNWYEKYLKGFELTTVVSDINNRYLSTTKMCIEKSGIINEYSYRIDLLTKIIKSLCINFNDGIQVINFNNINIHIESEDSIIKRFIIVHDNKLISIEELILILVNEMKLSFSDIAINKFYKLVTQDILEKKNKRRNKRKRHNDRKSVEKIRQQAEKERKERLYNESRQKLISIKRLVNPKDEFIEIEKDYGYPFEFQISFRDLCNYFKIYKFDKLFKYDTFTKPSSCLQFSTNDFKSTINDRYIKSKIFEILLNNNVSDDVYECVVNILGIKLFNIYMFDTQEPYDNYGDSWEKITLKEVIDVIKKETVNLGCCEMYVVDSKNCENDYHFCPDYFEESDIVIYSTDGFFSYTEES